MTILLIIVLAISGCIVLVKSRAEQSRNAEKCKMMRQIGKILILLAIVFAMGPFFIWIASAVASTIVKFLLFAIIIAATLYVALNIVKLIDML